MKDWTIRKFSDTCSIRIHTNNCVALLFYHLVSAARARPVPHHFWKSLVTRPISLPPSQTPWKAQRKHRLCIQSWNSTMLGKANLGHGLPPGTPCLLWDSAPVSTSPTCICFPISGWVWATDVLILRLEWIHPDETDHKRMGNSKDPCRTAALSLVPLQLKASCLLFLSPTNSNNISGIHFSWKS